MGWEQRGRTPRYTQTIRCHGGFRRFYVGRGSLAELAAQTDSLFRAERQAVAEARREERARWQAALAPLEELGRLADLLSRAALLAAGFHQHARGEWRRRSDRRNNSRGR